MDEAVSFTFFATTTLAKQDHRWRAAALQACGWQMRHAH